MRALVLVMCGLMSLGSVATAATVTGSVSVGAPQVGIAVDSGRHRAFVAAGTEVVAIDTMTDTVVGSYWVGDNAAFIALDPQRGHAFVSHWSDYTSSVLVLDEDTLAEVGSLDVGGLGLAIDPSHDLLYSTNSVMLGVYDLATLAAVAVVPSNGQGSWWGVDVDPATDRIYLEDLTYGSYAVVVMDASSYQVLTRIALSGETRFGVTVDVARDLVYVPNYSSDGSVAVIDGTTNAVVSQTPVASFPFTLLLDGDRLFVASLGDPYAGGGAVTTLSAGSTPTVLDVTPLSTQPGATALADTSRLYVANQASNDVSILTLTKPNTPPVIDGVTVTPAAPLTNDVLTATVTAHDADSDPLTYTYQWTKDGADIAGATSATLDLAVAGNGDRGDTIAVRVVASDGQATSAPFTSGPVTVGDSAPVASVALSTPLPTVRDTLVATATASDADGDALTLTYVWSVNGTVVRTTTTAVTSDALDLSRGTAHVGDVITVTLTASDGLLTSASSYAVAIVRPGP